MKSKAIEELAVHAILLLGMGVLYRETSTFPDMNIGGNLGPRWWPQLVLSLAMVMTLASAGFVLKKGLGTQGGGTRVQPAELRSLGVSVAIFVVFLLAIQVVGFLGAVPIFMLGFMLQLGARSWPSLVLVPLLSGPIFALVFGRLMEVPLPRGMGLARIASFYLY
jgi:putative tricarboxylic transport membrane protein